MKRLICMSLTLLLLLSLSACHPYGNFKKPASFYYPRLEYVFGDENALFGTELHEADELTPKQLLSEYLSGPKDPALTCQIPQGTALLSVDINGTDIILTLNDRFAELSGIDLTLAGAALAKTCMEYTGASNVILRAESTQLDGQDQIIFNVNSIHYYDGTNIITTDAYSTEES